MAGNGNRQHEVRGGSEMDLTRDDVVAQIVRMQQAVVEMLQWAEAHPELGSAINAALRGFAYFVEERTHDIHSE